MRTELTYPKRTATVLGHTMAYVDIGEGDPVVFLHGNPTSSYLWRNILPHCEGLGRLIAPDLIGMGDSDKLPGTDPARYRYAEHRKFLDALLAEIDVSERIIFVLHDWGTVLGCDWAMRHPSAISGIAYMEGIVRPRRWSDFPEGRDRLFRLLRSPEGVNKVLDENFFVETVLPGSILRPLSQAEMDAYRAPFRDPGQSRMPTLVWAREQPIENEPPDVVRVVGDCGAFLGQSPIPKLLISGEPGAIILGETLAYCRAFPNQTEVRVKGVHYLQEDSPEEIGSSVAEFVRRIRAA